MVQSWKATHLATLDIRVEQKKNLVPKKKKQFKKKSLSIPHFQKPTSEAMEVNYFVVAEEVCISIEPLKNFLLLYVL